MSTCACGHERLEHRDDTGRCSGCAYDTEFGRFACLCTTYVDIEESDDQ